MCELFERDIRQPNDEFVGGHGSEKLYKTRRQGFLFDMTPVPVKLKKLDMLEDNR